MAKTRFGYVGSGQIPGAIFGTRNQVPFGWRMRSGREAPRIVKVAERHTLTLELASAARHEKLSVLWSRGSKGPTLGSVPRQPSAGRRNACKRKNGAKTGQSPESRRVRIITKLVLFRPVCLSV